jgi:hypothetical protein
LRQGDILSPILFNIVVDMLTILIKRVKLIDGVVPHLVDNVLSILQYAYDTLIFMDDNLDKAKNLKLVLCTFEQLLGLKINFYKSEIFCFGEARNFKNIYSQLFGCQLGPYPSKYLGIPIHYKRINGIDWKQLEHRIGKKLNYLERKSFISGW